MNGEAVVVRWAHLHNKSERELGQTKIDVGEEEIGSMDSLLQLGGEEDSGSRQWWAELVVGHAPDRTRADRDRLALTQLGESSRTFLSTPLPPTTTMPLNYSKWDALEVCL